MICKHLTAICAKYHICPIRMVYRFIKCLRQRAGISTVYALNFIAIKTKIALILKNCGMGKAQSRPRSITGRALWA